MHHPLGRLVGRVFRRPAADGTTLERRDIIAAVAASLLLAVGILLADIAVPSLRLGYLEIVPLILLGRTLGFRWMAPVAVGVAFVTVAVDMHPVWRSPLVVSAGVLTSLAFLVVLWIAAAFEDWRREVARRQEGILASATSERWLRVIADEMPHFVWTQSADGSVAYANLRCYDGLGIPRWMTPTSAVWEQIVAPDDLERLAAAYAECVRRERPFEAECRVKPMRAPDSAYRWHLARVVPVRDLFGKVARWIGTATDIHETKLAAEGRDRGWRMFAEAVPQIVWRTTADGTIDYINSKWCEFTGLSEDESLGHGGNAAIHPDDRARALDLWRRALATDAPFEAEYRLRDRTGAYRCFLARGIPLRDEAGSVQCWLGTSTDIEDRKRAEQTLRILMEAGPRLASSLETSDVYDELLALIVPRLGDRALIAVSGESGWSRVVASAGKSDAPDRGAELVGVELGDARRSTGLASVLRTGMPAAWPAGSAEWLDDRSSDLLRRAPDLRGGSAVAVPLLAGRRVFGLLAVFSGASGIGYTEADLELFCELGRRAAIAIKNAQAFEHERRVADTFQAAALPGFLPNHPLASFYAVYEAGRSEALVGGDWYDALVLFDGRILLSIGDVAGSGLRAAVTMSAVRQAIRTAAQMHADPCVILDAADRTLRANERDGIVTAFVGLLDPHTYALQFACAGHPPPLLRSPDGRIVELPMGGPPLGLWHLSAAGMGVLDVEPGSALILYTDGLVEATKDLDEGERRLRAAVSDVCARAVDPANAIKNAVLTDGARDDVAILVVRFEASRAESAPEYGRYVWTYGVRDALEATAARKRFVSELRTAGIAESEISRAELVFGELVGNAARHAPGSASITAVLDGGELTIHVLDRGPGFEPNQRGSVDELAEFGRGLIIVSRVADGFNVAPRTGGGAHTRARLLFEDRITLAR
jgi:PAS domain S-box-containing protein